MFIQHVSEVGVFLKENQTSVSSDGNPRNAGGANKASMIGGISGGSSTGSADDEMEALGEDISRLS